MINKNYVLAVSGIFYLGWLTVLILSLVGLGYLTKMTFTSNVENGKLCVEKMDNTKRNIARMTVVLLWISIGSSLLMSLSSVNSSSKNSFSF